MRSKSWMLSLLASTTLASTLLIASLASADELKMTAPPQASENLPKRGVSMDKVEATFGAPANRVPAVGDPPIARWEYPSFVVYFEHNLVLHSVVKL